MDLGNLISPDDILSSLRCTNKRQLLHELSEVAGKKTGIAPRKIFDTLLQRERLGSTGAGNGVAIPHGKLAGLKRITALFARLERPIEFDSVDELPVDVIFLLLAPEGAGADHLKALARIARVMREPDKIDKLRDTADAAAIYSLLTDTPASNAA